MNLDIRAGAFPVPESRHHRQETVLIYPDVQSDFRALPFRDSVFDAILFDPPHDDWGKTSFMAVLYGSWLHRDFVGHVFKANTEFARVLKTNGWLLTKILTDRALNHQRSLETLLSNFGLIRKYRMRSRAYHNGPSNQGVFYSVFQQQEAARR